MNWVWTTFYYLLIIDFVDTIYSRAMLSQTRTHFYHLKNKTKFCTVIWPKIVVISYRANNFVCRSIYNNILFNISIIQQIVFNNLTTVFKKLPVKNGSHRVSLQCVCLINTGIDTVCGYMILICLHRKYHSNVWTCSSSQNKGNWKLSFWYYIISFTKCNKKNTFTPPLALLSSIIDYCLWFHSTADRE